MQPIPFGPFQPARSRYALLASTTAINVVPIKDGWGPLPSLVAITEALASTPKGSILVRTSAGSFAIYAGTTDKLYRMNTSSVPYTWDHVSALSADQVTNGGFGADSDWTKGTNVTIAAGVGTFTASPDGESLSQAQSFSAGTIYKVVFTVSGYSAGGVRPVISGGTSVNGTSRTADGTYTEYLTAVTGNTTFELEAVGTTTLNVDNVTVQALASYNVPVGDRWDFDIYGTELVATNINDGLLYIDVDSGSNFASESNAPNAKYVWGAGEHLVLGHTADSPNEIRWSAIRDRSNWTEGSRGSSSQIFQSGNEVQGGIGSQNGAIVFQRDMIRTQIRNGDITSAFNIDILNPAIGAISPLSIVNISTNNFAWLSEKGFFMGPNAEPIGEIEDIDGWFLSGDELDLTLLPEVVGMNDPFRDIVWWQYQKTDATKALLGYNYFHRRWCYSDQNVSDLSAMATAAVTIDGLDALYASIDDADIAFDARLLQGGRPTLNGWDTDNKLGIFSGPYLQATVTTADVQLGPGHTTPHEMRVVTDATGVTVKQTTSQWHGGTRTQGAAVSQHARTGMVNFRKSALLHGFEATIPAGADWSFITAIAPVRVSKDGNI